MIHWRIHRLQKQGEAWTPGAQVAEVVSADGAGQLVVLDEHFREALEDLFLFDQVVVVGSEPLDGGQGTATIGDVLPPWRDDTLEVVRRKLPRHGLTAVDAASS